MLISGGNETPLAWKLLGPYIFQNRSVIVAEFPVPVNVKLLSDKTCDKGCPLQIVISAIEFASGTGATLKMRVIVSEEQLPTVETAKTFINEFTTEPVELFAETVIGNEGREENEPVVVELRPVSELDGKLY